MNFLIPDKKPTDNEIIKAFEVCNDIQSGGCSECPYDVDNFCIAHNVADLVNLINRQKAEIERLQRELNNATYYLNEIADDWEDWDD